MARRSNAELSDATRALLLAEARKVFAAAGYADAAIDAVVAAAGLTKGALYHHFGSKRGLFLAVLRDADVELTRRMRAVLPAAGPSRAALLAACRVFLEAMLEPGLRRLLLLDGPAVLGPRATRAYDAEHSIAPLAEELAAMRAAGELGAADPDAVAHLLVGALAEAALWIGEVDAPQAALEHALAALGAMLDGLAPRPDPGRRRIR